MSSSEIKNVVVIGAGGNLGPTILKTLLEESSFNVTVLSREGSKSTFPDGVKVARADYESVDSLKTAFQGADAVISLVGSSALGDQNKLIDAAIAAGVKRFLPSEYGSDTTNDKLNTLIPVFAPKVGAVDYLKSKESEISWSSIISGAFFDWGLKVTFLGINPHTKTATLIDGGSSLFATTNLRTIGRAIIKTLEKPDLTKNQYIYISSFVTSQKQLLEASEKITGTKWTVENVVGQELLDAGKEKLSKHDYSGVVDLLKATVFGDFGVADFSSKLWNEKLGLPKEDFEESVKTGLSGKLVGEK
ncbi:isoflavone reductase family protein-like protein CipA [Melanomma pulvis-pyrius CBS 109.77]|uniref:Isoflavone reductase family protein-like protein CipA n=1 Tax=Melanomma pulvis-pyrius CBS 109.77 TaxID=1314802 RepID=A0A6A6X520_9PLEO|nr:isoflavone reductase family protein-like protein CipA [Melanomma pulvis-pyrius CBS 109.77]